MHTVNVEQNKFFLLNTEEKTSYFVISAVFVVGW